MASGGGSKSKEKTVLVAIDPSEHSMRAFNWYLEHFYRSDQIIGLAHIYTHPEHHEFGRRHGNALEGIECQQHDEDVKKVEQDHVELVKKYEEICKAKGLRYREFCMERKSSVGEAICDIAKENSGISCIVMGQRGHGAIKRALYGSVSEYVLHHAHTTVVIVPPEKK